MLDPDVNDRPPPVHERPTWLTYAQAGERLGLSPEAVRHRARRSGWRTQPGNDGRTLVMVPEDEMADIRPRPPVRAPVHTAGHAAMHASETPVRTLDHHEEIARANARADRAEQRADEATRRAEDADTDRRAAIALADQSVTLLAEAAARADRTEAVITAERQRADDLRAQINVLNAELVATGAEADRTMADERMRADRLNERVDALSADLTRAETDRRVAEVRADKAETAVAAEHARADALRTAIDELKAGQALMADIHARDLAVAQHDAQAGQQAAAVLRQAEAERKARGRLRRAWDGWRGR